jgi:acyl-CoA thioesterase-1
MVLWGPLAFAESKDTLRILAFGDSLTAGYRLPKDQAFAARIQESLRAKGFAVEVYNAGVSGDTARQGQARIAWTLKRGGPFDIVLLGLGANDGLRNSPIEQMKQSLAECIEAFQKAGLKVYLLGMQLPLNYSPQYRKDFEEVYRDLSKKYSIPLYPFILEGVALNKNFNLQDLIHPNKEGHEVIAQKIEAWLLQDKEFTKRLERYK